jgi:demethylmenaquinone methyltransferase/2-methoxy-6-polyprenyl-1,4-benzoquinol methylase
MPRAQLDKMSDQVSAMFDEVAPGYDRARAALWFGQTRRWGRHNVAALALKPGDTVLDVACGTGSSSIYLARSGAIVTGCDFSTGMLGIARKRAPALAFVPGNALDLPFESASFDAATISFGLRNVADVQQVLTEMRRVVRPGAVAPIDS